MGSSRSNRRTLAWQAALICFPVLLLACLGAYYLRQDRILVKHDAEERARTLAQEAADKLWTRLSSPATISQEQAFQIDPDGALLFPPPFESTPTPQPLALEALTPEQIDLWRNSDSASLERFIASSPPQEFAVIARYRLGIALASESKLDNAAAALRAFIREYPDAVGETGLPLAPLATLKQISLGNQGRTQASAPAEDWDSLCRSVIVKPSALTPMILESVARAGALPQSRTDEYVRQWQAHEKLRELYRHSRAQLSPASPPLFWIHAHGERWLASRVTQSPTNRWVVCRRAGAPHAAGVLPGNTRADVRAMRVSIGPDLKLVPGIGTAQVAPPGWESVLDALPPIPSYMAIAISAAAEPVITITNTPVLASATSREDGRELLRVSLHLASPELLYARQKQRVVWFGVLIALSTIAAGAGVMGVWRGVERQERLAELKDNFVASVSHELRAPIASVRLMAEGLERGRVQEPQKQREYFRFIVQECQRLSALIQNVLDFSRIDQGRKDYQFESADVSRLVEEAVKTMEPVAHERQITLAFSPPNAPINAVLDARAIQQALINLIDNALKHSPPGSQVLVSVNSQVTPQPLLRLSVEDHGEGIPKTEHERIFERFYRVGSELRRQTPGAGIGLSIVKHIVEAHDGRVRVESQVGQGSRFMIELPLKR